MHKKDTAAKREVKRSLGLTSLASLPKCPCKSHARAKKLDYEIDPSGKTKFHRKKSHFCNECCCHENAGKGTAHVGSGYCYQHEKKYSKILDVELIAEKHRQAIITRNPFAYRDALGFLKRVVDEGEKAGEQTQLKAEIDVTRSLIQELLDKFGEARNNINSAERAIGDLALVIRGKEFIDGTDRFDIMDKLDRILQMVSSSLTEKGRDGPMPMSDATRITLITKAASAIGKLSVEKLTIDAREFIELDDFRIWNKQIVLILKRVVTDQKVLSEIATAMAKLPPPRIRMGQQQARK